MRAFLAGARMQLRFFRAYPDGLIPFFTAPMYAIIFQMIFRHAGRQDLTAYAAIAPVFIASKHASSSNFSRNGSPT